MLEQKNILLTHNYLGHAWSDRGKENRRYLSLEDRRRHVHIIGAPGTGKSTMLLTFFHQEVNNGRGVLLIDNQADLARAALALVPTRRFNKTIYFNANDYEFPIGFNPIGNVPPRLQARRVADIVDTLHALWSESWGPQLNHILHFSLSALIEQGDATLLCVPRLLRDADYRARILQKVKDAKTIEFWNETFPLYNEQSEQGGRVFTPILNKLDALMAAPQVRHILANPKSAFDIAHLINNRYIVIANLSGLGSEAASLLGALLVSCFASAAKMREDMPEKERLPFAILMDEFGNYKPGQMTSLLSEGRALNLSLILAHQFLDQIDDKELRGAILGTIGSHIVFRVSGKDAKEFAAGPLPDYPPEHYATTPNWRANCTILQYGNLSQTFELHPLPPPRPLTYSDRLLAHSRRQWATAREQIQSRIDRFLTQKKTPKPTEKTKASARAQFKFSRR